MKDHEPSPRYDALMLLLKQLFPNDENTAPLAPDSMADFRLAVAGIPSAIAPLPYSCNRPAASSRVF